MTSARKKHLAFAFVPAAGAALLSLLSLLLLAPSAQAHARTPRADNCTCDVVSHHATKKVVKKAAHKKVGAGVRRKHSAVHRLHRLSHATIRVKNPNLVVAQAPARSAPVVDYVRIIPEQNCNMEPSFAVPTCQARQKAAGQ